MYVMYYASMLRCWQLISILVRTNHPCLGVVTMHLRQGKKVSILLLGDVNPGPVPSRWGLLEDSPYRAVGAVCPSCDESRLCT
jgi:hypothetical protein